MQVQWWMILGGIVVFMFVLSWLGDIIFTASTHKIRDITIENLKGKFRECPVCGEQKRFESGQVFFQRQRHLWYKSDKERSHRRTIALKCKNCGHLMWFTN